MIALTTTRFLSLSVEMASPMMVYHTELRPWVFFNYVGFASAALFLAPFQFWKGLLAKGPNVHRLMGRAYVAAVIVSGDCGLILAITTRAGPVAGWGFGMLAVVWIAVTLRALWLASQRRIWMIRSAALTFAGVTLRILLPIPFVTELPFDATYSAIAWLCWVPNLLIVESWLRGRNAHPA